MRFPFHNHKFNHPQIENVKKKKKKIPECSKMQNLKLLDSGNYLHSIYIVLHMVGRGDLKYMEQYKIDYI